MARTNNLTDFLSDVADAIRTKKGTSETIPAKDFDTEIENLPSGGGKYAPQYVRFGLNGITDLSYEVENLDTSNMTTMISMFNGAGSITSLNISGFNTSNVTSFEFMFQNCSSLTSINFGNIDTSKVTTMNNMFSGCRSLTTLDLSKFIINSNIITSGMFMNCTSLEKLDIRTMPASKLSGTYMFSGVSNNCEIIVNSQTEKDVMTSSWPNLTNVKTVAEYEAEQNA